MSTRMSRYLPLVQDFSARAVLLHEAVGASLGLNATDVKVLRLLGDDTMTAGDLAERVGVTAAAVTALLDRLHEAGYLSRERDPADRRRVTVKAVTAKVRKLDRQYAGFTFEMNKLLGNY